MVVFSTVDCVQSDEAVTSMPSQSPLTLSPSLTVNGFDVRAQWYPFHEWLANAAGAETAAIAATAAKARAIRLLIWPP
jgi:hypothetical protein